MKKLIPLMFLIALLSGCINPPHVNSVYLSPSSSSYHVGDTFTVAVMCDIDQRIKGWETEITFNATVLRAVAAEQGDLFNETNCFQSPNMDLDNYNGTILRVYAVVINNQTISGSGSLLKITFTAVAKGTSDIALIETGLYNATSSIQIETGSSVVVVS